MGSSSPPAAGRRGSRRLTPPLAQAPAGWPSAPLQGRCRWSCEPPTARRAAGNPARRLSAPPPCLRACVAGGVAAGGCVVLWQVNAAPEVHGAWVACGRAQGGGREGRQAALDPRHPPACEAGTQARGLPSPVHITPQPPTLHDKHGCSRGGAGQGCGGGVKRDAVHSTSMCVHAGAVPGAAARAAGRARRRGPLAGGAPRESLAALVGS